KSEDSYLMPNHFQPHPKDSNLPNCMSRVCVMKQKHLRDEARFAPAVLPRPSRAKSVWLPFLQCRSFFDSLNCTLQCIRCVDGWAGACVPEASFLLTGTEMRG